MTIDKLTKVPYKGLEKQVRRLEEQYETVIWMSDNHVPYHDRQTKTAVYDFIKDMQPDYVVIGGDFMDFYSVSKFDKNPQRASHLQDELDTGIELLKELRGLTPKSKLVYLEGNHERRMEKLLKAKPELYGLRALEVEKLLTLKEIGIEYKQDWYYKGFLFKHGDNVYKYSCNKELEVEGVSGMSGHTHRNQMMSKTGRDGVLAWHSIGHLSDLEQVDWLEGTANWQQGIAVVHFRKGSKRYHVTHIPIVKKKFIYNSKQYGR